MAAVFAWQTVYGLVIFGSMKTSVYVPNSIKEAFRELNSTSSESLESLPKAVFVRSWCALSYAFPGLHPDDLEQPDGGWPDDLKRFAVEAWRREEAGEMSDEEMYPSDAAWAGVYDQMVSHTQEETDRRFAIAAESGAR